MRAVSACLLFVLAAAAVNAACTVPSSDPLNPSSTTGCNMIQACQANLCSCTSGSGSYPSCLTSNTDSCTATQNCFTTYFQCLTAVSSQRSNTSNSACSSYASTLYMAQLSAAASVSTFTSSALYASCAYDLCTIANMTGSTSSCAISTTVTSAVCTAFNLLGASTSTPVPTTATPVPTTNGPQSPTTKSPTGSSTTPAPSSTPAPTYDILATLRISGANWSLILNNATAAAQLAADFKTDIATVIGVAASYVSIFSTTVGSLAVNFGVITGSGQNETQLNDAVQSAAASSTWLTSTSALYSSVGTDSVTVLSVTVTATSAPGSPIPAPTPAPSSASRIGAVAAALFALIALTV